MPSSFCILHRARTQICVYSRPPIPHRHHFVKSVSRYRLFQSMTDFTLSQFLSSSKDRYLSDVRQGNGREWTVVMGNEAGDLDTIASSIAYAWVLTETRKTPTIPLIQTKRSDLGLRPENIHALLLAGLQNQVPELLCIDDMSCKGAFPSKLFALVDHNRLLPEYDVNNPDVRVVAIVDHHDDEGFYMDSAAPRIIAPAGSSASHVTCLCPPQIPAGFASLLLSAILIDTQGLKAGGKTLQVDREAVALLMANSPLSASFLPSNISPSSARSLQLTYNLAELKPIQTLTRELSEKKFSVSHLNTRDLLRRDYKQYRLKLPWLHSRVSINAGLSTVPADFKLWIARDPKGFWSDTKLWMEETELYVLGILTSYRKTGIGRSSKGKHKRQMLWVVREGAEVLEESEPTKNRSGRSAVEPPRVDVDQLASRLWDGLLDSAVLQLTQRDFKKFGTSETDADPSMRVRIFKQANVDATRKAAAPLLKNILEGHGDGKGKM